MTWLTWRQFRIPALAVYAALAAVGVVLAITGPDLVGRTEFTGDAESLYTGTMLAMYLLPAVLGVFWGVPMVTRELETGTHNLVWNQTVTRGRWLAVKLGTGALAAALAAGLLSLAVGWWASPIDTMASAQPENALWTRISPALFGARGIAPIGYAVFALVLGVAVGILLRRTVAAMAVTLVVFAAVQLLVPVLVRPYVLPATEEAVTITGENITRITGNQAGVIESIDVAEPSGAWVLTNETVDPSGAAVSPLPDAVQGCMPAPGEGLPDRQTVVGCLTQLSDLGYQQRLEYHRADDFWPLQWIETAFFLALSALLARFCFRRLRHLS